MCICAKIFLQIDVVDWSVLSCHMTLFSHLADGPSFLEPFSELKELAFWGRERAPPAASLGSYSFEGSVVWRSLSLQFPHESEAQT